MRNLDRFWAVMEYGDFDHPPFFEEPVWRETLERWQGEGLAENTRWEEQLDVHPLRMSGHGFNSMVWPPFERQDLGADDQYVYYNDNYGRKVRDFKNATGMPEWLEFPLKDRESFESLIDRFEGHFDERVPEDWDERVRKWNAPDFDRLLLPPVGNYFFTLRGMAGVETVSYLFFDAPDLIHRMFDAICGHCCRFLEKILAEVHNIRAVGTGEDMAYKNGPFFSPAMFDEFFAPRYRRVMEIARRNGANLCFVDTDGDFRPLLKPMLECGLNLFCPMEVAAGADPVSVRETFGREVRMVGGVDKRIVAAGKEEIRAELERLYPLMCEGGFIPKIDHSVSSDISWDNFRYYIDTLRELHRRCAVSGAGVAGA